VIGKAGFKMEAKMKSLLSPTRFAALALAAGLLAPGCRGNLTTAVGETS
jgi:hypothetical protein